MKKHIYKLLLLSICIIVVIIPVSVNAHNDQYYDEINTSDFYLVITDPETEETWEWSLSDTDINVDCRESIIGFDKAEPIILKEVEVDVTPYLEQTIKAVSKEWASSSHTSGVKIKTSLQYSVNAKKNTVRLYKTKGSTTNIGYYYASNRHTTWRNPGAGVGGSKYPSSSSWEYNINSAEGTYYYQNPPFSFAECRVHITGMTAYRDISILNPLNNVLQ